MNLDFHYYGTYCAAIQAGYQKETAARIAYYAQFVDECTKGRLKENQDKENGYPIVPTVQSEGEITTTMLNLRSFKKNDLAYIAGIWVPFHFLPGNTGSVEVQYEGPTEDTAKLIGLPYGSWAYNTEEQLKFKLLCLPNSDLVISMVNTAVEKAQDVGQENDAAHIGMVMHVLADTWAHQYFAGIPAWFINDVPSMVSEERGGENQKLSWFTFRDSTEGSYQCTTSTFRYDGMMYLGHGRIGHIPDYSYMTYKYIPMWRAKSYLDSRKKSGSQNYEKDYIIKNNPEVFTSAYKQMVYALQCIKDGRPFRLEDYLLFQLDEKEEESLLQMFRTRTQDLSEGWIKHIRDKGYNEPEAFRYQKAFEEYKAAKNKDDTDLYRFLNAAMEHRELVSSNLIDPIYGAAVGL